MRTEELIERISKHEPLLAKAVSHMVAYVQDRYPSTFPSKEQTMAVNEYLHSVHADGDGSMSEANCEHRRIASQRITIAAIRILDTEQQDRLQDILDPYCIRQGVLYAGERARYALLTFLLAVPVLDYP